MDKSDESTVSNWEKQQYDSVDNQNEFYQNIFQASKTSHYKSCYEEIAFIGEGGYGKVYRARNKFDDEYYAVKKILISDSVPIQRVLKENKVWAKLKNNFIVQYKSSWIESEEHLNEKDKTISNQRILYIQMELCEMSLRDAMNIINIELNQSYNKGVSLLGTYMASEFFEEILEGVNYLHTQNLPIIHRDLKLSNIMITSGESGHFIKIGDFGLATIHGEEEIDEKGEEYFDLNYYHTGRLGTDKYMAQEVKTGKYDTSADMYSLGVIMCELFCVDINELKNDGIIHELKQIKVIKELLQEWASKRPNCHQLLLKKHEWNVTFNEIKFSKEFRYVLYNWWILQFYRKDDLDEYKHMLSMQILFKKCKFEVEKLSASINTTDNEKINEFISIKSALNVNTVQIDSNIQEEYIKDNILEVCVHGLHLCIHLSELCEYIEKELNITDSQEWHCFLTPKYVNLFSESIINWCDCPIYLIMLTNDFSVFQFEIAIINTTDRQIHNLSNEDNKVKIIKMTLSDEESDLSIKLSLNAVNECLTMKEMQEYIIKGLIKQYPEKQWNCYINKNELIFCFDLPINNENILAFCLDEFRILIIRNKKLQELKLNKERIRNLPIDDKNAIDKAFSTEFISNTLILKKVNLTEDKKCLLRISDSLIYTSYHDNNYKLLHHNLQVMWLPSYNNQSIISCCNGHMRVFRKYIPLENELIDGIETIFSIINNENSDNDQIIDALKVLRKIFANNMKEEHLLKISQFPFIDIMCGCIDKRQNVNLIISFLRTSKFYISLVNKVQHVIITPILVNRLVKLLRSNDDNICFEVVEFFSKHMFHCEQCFSEVYNGDILPELVELLKPNKSLSLIDMISVLLADLVIRSKVKLQYNDFKIILSAVDVLIEHNNETIVSLAISILGNVVKVDKEFKNLTTINKYVSKLLRILNFDNQQIKHFTMTTLVDLTSSCIGKNKLDANLFKYETYVHFVDLLNNDNLSIINYVFCILNRIFFQKEEHIQPLIESNIIFQIIDLINNAVLLNDSVIFITSAIFNIAASSGEKQLIAIYEHNLIPASRKILTFIMENENKAKLCFHVIALMNTLLLKLDKRKAQIRQDIKNHRLVQDIQLFKDRVEPSIGTKISELLDKFSHISGIEN